MSERAKKRVAVVFGGRSVEHDVSIVTAHQVMAALQDRHQLVPVYVTKEGDLWTGSALNDLEVFKDARWADVGTRCSFSQGPEGGLALAPRRKGLSVESVIERPDVVVPSIHGTFGEDGTLQGLLELANLPYTGSGVVASAVGMDKVAMKAAFRSAGLPVVDDVLIETTRFDRDKEAVLDSIENKLGYPCFVKPVKAGSSVGIARATDRASLGEAIEVARAYDRRVLVERSMEGCIEVNCSVLGGPGRDPRVSVCEQPVAWQEFLSFEDKYLRGEKGDAAKASGMAGQERRIPAPISEQLTKQVQENAQAAFKVIDAAGVARIDAFVREETGETWVMEINTVPGSFSFYLWEASGLEFPDLMDELIDIALQTHAANKNLMFSFDSSLLHEQPGRKSGG